MTITVCTKAIFSLNWTRSHIRSPSPRRERRSTLPTRTYWRPQRWCAVSKHKPGAGAGNCKAPLALLHDRVAPLDKSKATLALAQVEFDRAKQLLASGTASRQEYDRRQEALSTASAQVTQALAAVHEVRASLGLPPQPDRSDDLDQVPPNLDQTFSSVLQAQADLIQSAAQLGVVHSYGQNPKQMLHEFEKQGDIDRTFAELTTKAPSVKQAEAKLEVANRELAQAELDLRYCDIVAEIDGVVRRRNVNPGNYVQIGQNLMAVRSLDDIWVDANFKETQLRDLRIGQAVDLYLDMYGDRHVFKGRVAGFTMGTGSTLALLPAQTRRATSSKWYSGCRSGLSWKNTTRIKTLCLLALRLFHTFT